MTFQQPLASSNYSALPLAGSWGVGMGLALKGNSQIQTFYSTQKAWRSWTAEWTTVIHKKGVFLVGFFVCF